VSGAAGKTLTSEEYKRSGKLRSVKSDVRTEETRDPASGTAGKTSSSERNERCQERHSRQDVDKRKKRAFQ
jgi:hypothetical protein